MLTASLCSIRDKHLRAEQRCNFACWLFGWWNSGRVIINPDLDHIGRLDSCWHIDSLLSSPALAQYAQMGRTRAPSCEHVDSKMPSGSMHGTAEVGAGTGLG